MAVYFEPQRRGYGDYIGMAISQLLGHALQRSQNAQQYELGQRAENEAMARRQAEQDMIGQIVQDMTSSGRINSATPQAYQSGLLELGARYPHMAPYIQGIAQQAAPHLQPFNVNLGDHVEIGSFNPRKGFENMTFEDVGIEPTRQHESDNLLAGAKYSADQGLAGDRVRAGATTGAARINNTPVPQLVRSSDGNYYYSDAGNGTMTPTGVGAPVPTSERTSLLPYTGADNNLHMVDPFSGKVTGTGLALPPPVQQSQTGPTLKELGDLNTRGFDGEGFGVLPGFEGIEAARIAAIMKKLGIDSQAYPGMSSTGMVQGPAPQGVGHLGYEPEIEQQIAQMSSMTGESRENVIAYLKKRGVIRQ